MAVKVLVDYPDEVSAEAAARLLAEVGRWAKSSGGGALVVAGARSVHVLAEGGGAYSVSEVAGPCSVTVSAPTAAECLAMKERLSGRSGGYPRDGTGRFATAEGIGSAGETSASGRTVLGKVVPGGLNVVCDGSGNLGFVGSACKCGCGTVLDVYAPGHAPAEPVEVEGGS